MKNQKQIKGYSKYAFNEKNEVINIKTGKVQNPKAQNGKYQLFDDKGVRTNKTKEQLAELMVSTAVEKIVSGKMKPKKEKVEVYKKPKKEEVNINVEVLLKNTAVKKIMDKDVFKHRKIYELKQAGYSNKEIQLITNSRPEVVSRDLWLYKVGKITA